MVNPATSTVRWKRHKQQNALALWGFAILCEWRTIGPLCKVSAWLLTDLCMPSPRQARLGTLPSLSFSPISSTNLLGAMKELNSFATLSLPKCHYHNVLRQPTVSTGSLLIVFFMGSWRQTSADILRALAAALVLSTSDKRICRTLFRSWCCSFELSVFGVCYTLSDDVNKSWHQVDNTDLYQGAYQQREEEHNTSQKFLHLTFYTVFYWPLFTTDDGQWWVAIKICFLESVVKAELSRLWVHYFA